MKNKTIKVKSVHSYHTENIGTRFTTIFIIVSILLSGITLIPNSPILRRVSASPSEEMQFDITCTDPIKEVGNQEGSRTANYIVKVTNYNGSIEQSNPLIITLNIEKISDSVNWSAGFNNPILLPQSTTVTFTYENISGDFRFVFLYVVASTTVNEEQSTAIKVNGTATDAITQILYVQTRMNSYEPGLFCKKSAKLIVPGYTVDYVINVINNGMISDRIEMDFSDLPPYWSVMFYKANGVYELDSSDPWEDSNPDTGILLPGQFRVIIARITAASNAEKYHQEIIDIIGTSDVLSSEKGIQHTKSTAVDLAFCISDNANRGLDKYYEEGEFTGHNVNPGMMTSYEIYIFKTSVDQQETRLNISYSSNPSWQAILEWNGNPGNPDVDVPAPSNIGDYNIAFLNITAPTNAKIENEFIVNVTAD